MPKRHINASPTGSAFSAGLMIAKADDGPSEQVTIGQLIAELLQRVTALENELKK